MTDRQNTTCEELTFARQQTDELFKLISEKALYSRPVQERHRLIFYFGHFEALDWNLLARRGMSERSFILNSIASSSVESIPSPAALRSILRETGLPGNRLSATADQRAGGSMTISMNLIRDWCEWRSAQADACGNVRLHDVQFALRRKA